MGQKLSTPLKVKEWKVVNASGDEQQILKETSADIVTIADAGNKLTATNVEDALQELASGVASAGKVDDVQAVDGSSIVTNKIAKLTKAAVGLGNVDNTADSEKIVKEAGKVTNSFNVDGYNLDKTTRAELTFDGGEAKMLNLNKDEFAFSYVSGIGTVRLASSGVVEGTYNGITVDSKGRVTNAVDGDYATNTDVNGKLDKKLDKTGGTITGSLSVNGGVTIGGNLTVNGTTTTVESQTLQVKDKLIEVAHGNTEKLTTPAGLVAPKYDGTNSGALVFDSDGIASVGDVTLDASGNIDVTRSQLQPLATRTGLVNDHLVKYDSANQTLVDSGKKITDFATAAQGSNADSALSKANANATEIANIKNGTNGTKVKYAEHADTADSATSADNATHATSADNATNATHATSADNATNATSANNATTATSANKVANALTIKSSIATQELTFDGSSAKCVLFNDIGLSKIADNTTYSFSLNATGVSAGSYSVLTVDSKGRATAGGRAFAFIEKDAAVPDDVMVGGLIFESIT